MGLGTDFFFLLTLFDGLLGNRLSLRLVPMKQEMLSLEISNLTLKRAEVSRGLTEADGTKSLKSFLFFLAFISLNIISWSTDQQPSLSPFFLINHDFLQEIKILLQLKMGRLWTFPFLQNSIIAEELFYCRRLIVAILFNIVCINYLLMVRLEKIVYEQALNTNMLGRSRSISTPMKWWTTNPMEQNKSMLHT